MISCIVALSVTTCSSDETTVTASANYSYKGPGSVWSVDLKADGSFTITKAASTSAAVSLTINGTYQRLSTGFIKFTVTSATGTDAPAAGSTATAVEVPGFALMLKPLGGDQIIPMVEAGKCPTGDMNANWVIVRKGQGNNGAASTSKDFFGTFKLSGTTPSLPKKYALAGPYTVLTEQSMPAGSACSSGLMQLLDGTTVSADMFLTSNGGAIVHTSPGSTDDSFIFGLPIQSVTAATVAGSYAGLLFDESNADGSEISFVSASLAVSGSTLAGSGNVVSNIDTGATTAGSVTISLNAFDSPSQGFMTGTITEGSNSGLIACMANPNANNSGKNVISCVGQSPSTNDNMFNVLLVSK